MDHAALLALLATCAPQVDAGTASALVAVESGMNPHAIGVVGGTLVRQPRHLPEAVATAKALQAGGWNFSLGLAQINVHNLGRLGLDVVTALEPCTNLAAMQTILAECFARARQRLDPETDGSQQALRAALSCYYGGNFSAGFRDGYVRRLARATATSRPSSSTTVKDQP